MNPNQKYDSPNNHEQPGSTFSRTPSGVQGVRNLRHFVRVTGKMPFMCDEIELPDHVLQELTKLDDTIDWRNFYEATR